LGSFSVIPCLRIWADFPWFRRSAIPAFRVARYSCQHSSIVDKDRCTVPSSRLPSPSLPSPKPALPDQSSLQTQPPRLRQVLLYFDQSGFNSYQKLKNQKLKSIFNFGFWSIDFRLSTGKTNCITIIFEFCLLRQIKVFFRRTTFIEFGT